MNLLVCTHGNFSEWRACFDEPRDRPRLPLPYAFGRACSEAGFTLNALDELRQSSGDDMAPFRTIYDQGQIEEALSKVDLAILWGAQGMRQSLREVLRPSEKRRIAFLTFGWREKGRFTLSRRANLMAVRGATRFARCVIAMTSEQVADARENLPSHVGVVPLSVGVDTRFYARPAELADVPEEHQQTIERLLQSPYIVLPGDELRLNDDALDVVERTGLALVRVGQTPHKSRLNALRNEIARRGLNGRVHAFERISYGFLRFLLQHAVAYAGLIDATWQPAGWTAACESLACGLPLVMYEGHVGRELAALGIPKEVCGVAPFGDRAAFARELVALSGRANAAASTSARRFAAERLDLEKTAPAFASALRSVLESAS